IGVYPASRGHRSVHRSGRGAEAPWACVIGLGRVYGRLPALTGGIRRATTGQGWTRAPSGVYDHMGMDRRARAAAAVVAASLTLAFMAALTARAAPVAAQSPSNPVDPSLSSRLRRIETAFRSGDASSLRPAFTATSKVRVDLKDVMD